MSFRVGKIRNTVYLGWGWRVWGIRHMVPLNINRRVNESEKIRRMKLVESCDCGKRKYV